MTWCVLYAGHHWLVIRTDADLLAADWIVRESGSGTRQGFDRACGLLPDLKLLLNYSIPKRLSVRLSLGGWCLSNIALKEPLQRGSVISLAAPQRDWHRQFILFCTSISITPVWKPG